MMKCPRCGRETRILYCHYDPQKDGCCGKCTDRNITLVVGGFFMLFSLVLLALVCLMWLPVLLKSL